MSFYGAQIDRLTYNAASRAFEALVILHEGPDRISVPVTFHAPMDTSAAHVRATLVQRAKRLRKRERMPFAARLLAGQPIEIPRAA